MKQFGLIVGAAALGACGLVPQGVPSSEVEGEGRAIGVTTDILVRPRVRPESLADLAAAAEETAPVAPAPSGPLGQTVASLGNPTEPGLWLKTPLVSVPGTGRVVYPGTGKSVTVTLLPLDGPATAGSQISLAAMQGIGAGLADLPTIEVFSGG